jgi:hypothetical protein
MEEILSTENYNKGTEKYSVRQTFGDFFPDRGCIFFVRPVNEESKLQRIETLDKNILRPEFLEALEDFKGRISENLVPKTFGGRELDGNGFLAMVQEILTSFNDKETPQLMGVIERIRGEEKRQRKNEIQKWVNGYLHENIGRDDLAEEGANELMDMTIGREGYEKNMEEDLFVEGWEYFKEEKKSKVEYEKVVRTKLLSKIMEKVKQNNPEMGVDELVQNVLGHEDLQGKKFTLPEIYDSIFKKLINSQKNQNKSKMQELQEQLREKELDLEHEKKKAEMADEEAKNWKKVIDQGEEEARGLRTKLKNQSNEMKALRDAQTGDTDLVLQLELVTAQKTELEKENERLKEGGGSSGGKPGNLQDLLGGLEGGEGSEEVRMMVEAMKEELMAENEMLREKMEELGHQNQNLKMEITDVSNAKEKEIQK